MPPYTAHSPLLLSCLFLQLILAFIRVITFIDNLLERVACHLL